MSELESAAFVFFMDNIRLGGIDFVMIKINYYEI